MRIIHAVKADILFQFRQGFYLVYVVITGMYLLILSLIPDKLLDIVTPLVIFSDPSVLGLFFIGGIIMLEKIQGVLSVLVVTPLRSAEYLLAKIISLSMISFLSGFAIAALTQHEKINWLLLFLSVIFTSGLFTMCGIIISAGCSTVNGYLLKMIPYMLLFVLPCFSLLVFPGSWLFTIVPSVAALRLMMGAYTSIPLPGAVGLVLYLAGINFLCFRLTLNLFERKIIFQD